MNHFRFQDPYWLLLLIPLALLIVLQWKRRARSVLVFSHTALFEGIPATFAARIKPLIGWLVYIGLGLMIVALARPQRGKEGFRVRAEGIALVMCIDRSGSMQAMDFFIERKRVDRLEVVKKVFRDFVLGGKELPGRPDDMVALVAFGGYVDSFCPLTLDHDSLAQMLAMIQSPQPLFDKNGQPIRSTILEEEAATAIGDALMCSVDRLRNSKAKSKVIILLSDGVQNTGIASAEEAAKVAAKMGIRVYTIGIGTSEPVPFPVHGPKGEKGYSRQIVELDEQMLKEIAKVTNGEYFHVAETDSLRKVCAEIDTLEKTTHEDHVFTKYVELYRGFLGSGLVLLLLGTILLQTRFRSLP